MIFKMIGKRLAQAVPLVLGISLLTFLVVNLAPGDPTVGLLENPHLSPETLAAIRERLGLGLPLHVRYVRWLAGIVQGDFGYSIEYQVPVGGLIYPRLINTLVLSVAASLIAWIVGILLGIFAAVRQGTWVDRIYSAFAMLALSTPRILLALVALLVAATTGWFPLGGMHSLTHDEMSTTGQMLDTLHHLILPALALSLYPLAVISNQMRGNLSEALLADFVRTARAKGLKRRVIIGTHAFRNAITPLIALMGYSIGNLLSGSALVETIMAWPGIGFLTVEAVFARDVYVIMASVMIGSVMLILGNLIADLLLAANDPRIRITA
jgi:peptide/nickel transport system permease protein